jgi:2',3'-cyclic-nucleotide 2'-phosphodiesterase/3'-nucleotidase
MHLSDVHAHLHPWDYARDQAMPGIGLAAAASMVERARADAPGALLFDGGDMLQGAPLGDLAAADAADAAEAHAGIDAPAPLHPVIAAMNEMGFDGAAFGNHDFNFGLDLAVAAAAQARFPVVLANMRCARTGGVGPFREWTMLERTLTDGAGAARAIRIGVVGFCPPQVALWDASHLGGLVAMQDILECARDVAPRMRAEGCDLIVALCHSGIAPGPHAPGLENAALQLAALGLVDVVLTGHQHLVLPGPDFAGIDGVDADAGLLAGVPAVMPGQRGEALGVVDLVLREDDAGRWRVVSSKAQVLRADPGGLHGPLARAVMAASQGAHQRTVEAARRPAGRIGAPLHSWFALIADSPAVRMVNRAQLAWAASLGRDPSRDDLMRNDPMLDGPMLDGPMLDGLPLLSAAAPFRAGWRAGPDAWIDLPAGEMSHRHIDWLYPFPNEMRVLEMTGAALALWLERAASIWAVVAPGARDVPLIDPRCAPYDFDVIDGLSWEVDLRAPPMFGPRGEILGAAQGAAQSEAQGAAQSEARAPGRIRDLRHQGRPVAPSARFALITNSYRAGGGGGYPGLGQARVMPAPRKTVGDALIDWLHDAPPREPSPNFAWRLNAPPGATAVFTSSCFAPTGAVAAAAAGGLTIERVDDTDATSDLFRLRF